MKTARVVREVVNTALALIGVLALLLMAVDWLEDTPPAVKPLREEG